MKYFLSPRSQLVSKGKANSFPDDLNANFWGKFPGDAHPKVILLSNNSWLQFVITVSTTEAEILSLMWPVWGPADAWWLPPLCCWHGHGKVLKSGELRCKRSVLACIPCDWVGTAALSLEQK